MLLDYFKGFEFEILNKNRKYIEARRLRQRIPGMRKHYLVMIGDVIRVVFHYKFAPLAFTGMCIAIRKKKFTRPDTGLILRNVIVGVGIELIVSYYYNRTYNLSFMDHLRKSYYVRGSKLFHVRKKTNVVSKV